MNNSQDILDKITAMKAQISYYTVHNYLADVDDMVGTKFRNSPVAVCDERYSFHGSTEDCLIDREWRKRICEWMYKIVDFYSFERCVVAVAVSYLDRFLCKKYTKCTMDQCQLVALTALYLAVKLHEPMSPMKASQLFVRFSDGHFQERDLFSMEKDIVRTLEWFLYPPTPQAFAALFLQLLPGRISATHAFKFLEISCYIIEMVVFDLELFSEDPARLACASIVLATEGSHSYVISSNDRLGLLTNLSEHGIVDSTSVTHLRDKIRNALEKTLGSMLVLHESIDPEHVIYPCKRQMMKGPNHINLIPPC